MQIVRWIVGSAVFLALLFLSLQNAEPVTLKFFQLASWQAPLVFVVFIAFAAGVASGLLAGALRASRLKRQLNRLRRDQRAGIERRHRAPRRRGARDGAGVGPGLHAPRPRGTGRRPPSADRAAMDFDLWWLLPIPAVFFALGWIAARIDIKHLLRESRALPLTYFRGLNFLLNEQPDKAIESFIEVVKVDPQTIDLHFALGSLFRRQGEIDRAIRMHQNLLDRADLPADKRTMATYELAQDFHRAGLLDRAEELFTKLNGTVFEHPALGYLISIYETEKDWAKAIAATRRMEELAKQPYFKEIAQYHCELAQAALLKADYAEGGGGPRRGVRGVPRLRARARCSPATRRRSRAARPRRSRRGRRSSRRTPRSCRWPPTVSPTRTASSATRRRASACCAATRRSTRRSTCSTRCSRWCWSTRVPTRPPRSSRTSWRAIRRCSASTGCWRRSSWPRPPTAATTSSS